MMKRILMTGGTGFVGSNFIKYYTEKSQDLVDHSLEIIPTPIISNLGSRSIFGIDNIEWDMNKPLNFKYHNEIDTILHCGAIVGEKEISPYDYLNVNIRSTIDLLEFSRKNDIKNFVYISTGGVYGTGSNYVKYPEDSACDPVGFYNISKYTSEKLCREYERYYGLNLAILRLFYPYGVGQKGRLVSNMIESIREKRPIIIYKNYAPVINPIYITDVSRIISLIIDGNYTGIYNVCGRDNVSIYEISKIIGGYMKLSPLYRIKDTDGKNLVGDIAHLINMFSSYMYRNVIEVSIKDGLLETVNGSK